MSEFKDRLESAEIFEIGKLRRVISGLYRVTLSDQHFGQIRRNGGKYFAEIRLIETGEFKRYAGVWRTIAEAREELCAINPLDL